MGLLDTLFASPGSAQGLQNAGLFGGLQALGAGLAAAGQMRPVGQPGPGLADAFLGYQRGAQAGLLGAYQQSEMDRKMKRTGLLAEAQSDKPDDQISPEARQLRPILSSLPPEVRAFAGPDELPGLAIQRGTQRQRPMTAEELAAGGFRPGSVVMVNDFTGNPNVVQQPDTMSPEALAQRLRIQQAGMQPQIRWTLVRDAEGNIVAKHGSNGDYVPLRPDQAPIKGGPGDVFFDPRTMQPVASVPVKPEPMNEATAKNVILRGWARVKNGQMDPNSPEGREYQMASETLLQPKPEQITREDGSVVQVMRAPQFTFPRLGGAPAAADGASAPAAPPGTPQPAPADPMVVKPAPPPTEAQAASAGYVLRMQEAEKRMDAALSKGANPGGTNDTMGELPGVGNFLRNSDNQTYRQAQEDWVRAKLRKESGAVIGKDEMAQEIATYFPRPGDSSAVVAQKAEARRTAIESLRIGAGRAAPSTSSRNVPPPPPGFQVVPR